MVFLEVALGKTAAVVAGKSGVAGVPLLKGAVAYTTSASSSSTAAATSGLAAGHVAGSFHPPLENLGAASSALAHQGGIAATGLGHLAGELSSRTASWMKNALSGAVAISKSHSSSIQLGLGLSTGAAGAFAGMLSYCGVLGEDDEEDDKEMAAQMRRGAFLFTPIAMSALTCGDLFVGGVLLHSGPLPLAIPLRTWAFGGIALSLPSTALINTTVKRHGVRNGFGLELAATTASFAWLAWGSMLLGAHPEVQETAPLLFWTCFAQATLAWSFLGIAVSFMVIITILTLAVDARNK